jgi:hypothetical protein
MFHWRLTIMFRLIHFAAIEFRGGFFIYYNINIPYLFRFGGDLKLLHQGEKDYG